MTLIVGLMLQIEIMIEDLVQTIMLKALQFYIIYSHRNDTLYP